jgi:ribosomal protein S18 acetylase RimI-like enzyme
MPPITIRPASPADIPSISRVHVDSWRTTYRHLLPASYLSSLSYEKHESRHHQFMSTPGTFYLVAESPSVGIIAFLSAGPHRDPNPPFAAEIYALYLLQNHQRQGIGSSLLRQAFSALLQSSLPSATVWALADNHPAVSFYQRQGGTLLRQQTLTIANTPLQELSFAWRDLTNLPSP